MSNIEKIANFGKKAANIKILQDIDELQNSLKDMKKQIEKFTNAANNNFVFIGAHLNILPAHDGMGLVNEFQSTFIYNVNKGKKADDYFDMLKHLVSQHLPKNFKVYKDQNEDLRVLGTFQ